jgi:hypothetical protein
MNVKLIFVFLSLVFMTAISCSTNRVSFTTTFDKNNEGKDGFYINGYVVNIDHETSQNLHMKKIKITGKVTIVKGMKYDKPGEDIRQGRFEDTKHILNPVIEIIN